MREPFVIGGVIPVSLEEPHMRKLIIAATTVVAFAGLAACENAAEKEAGAQADAIEANANVTATQLENQADVAPTDAARDNLNAQADAVQEKADHQADAVEAAAGNADGGMTTPPAKTN